MKKFFYNFLVVLFLSFVLFISCNNGSELIEQLNHDIKYNFDEYSIVTIDADSDSTKSIIPAKGKYGHNYKVTDEINIIFEPNPGYSLKQWSIIPEESAEIIDSKDDGKNVIIKIIQTAEITIKPICEYTEHLNISFKSEFANISPSVPKEYVVGESFNLECREESGYYFYRWQVFMEDDEENEITDFSELLEFENENQGIYSSSTIVTVKGVGKNIVLTPLLIKRPQVVNSTPVYDSNGSFRDSKIVIMFDEDMDESSIYYSDDEVQKLEADGNTVLRHNVSQKAYGYKDSKDEIHFKNISINKYSDSNENYLKYYNAPYFDENNKKVLRIAVNRSNLPPSITDIVVTIDKSFNFKDKSSNENVSLNVNYSFSYRTSSNIDNQPPYIGKIDDSEEDITVRFVPVSEAGKTDIQYDKNWKPLAESTFKNGTSLFDKDEFINNYSLLSKKVWLKCRISDGDSGLYKIQYTVTPIQMSFEYGSIIFPQPGDDNPITKIIETLPEDYGMEKDIDILLDLSETIVWGEVGYKLVFSVIDYAGNITNSKNFYYVYEKNYSN